MRFLLAGLVLMLSVSGAQAQKTVELVCAAKEIGSSQGLHFPLTLTYSRGEIVSVASNTRGHTWTKVTAKLIKSHPALIFIEVAIQRDDKSSAPIKARTLTIDRHTLSGSGIWKSGGWTAKCRRLSDRKI